ncbi:MAG: hypothetical protein JSU74_04670 [Candidatus Zixiibacteriota bacterium]|nr:MAG: hypothetical protein JSU74_04670 [candidate division Zixibacteria bacterium]
MTVESIKLNVSTPIEPIAPGRGFYRVEEESLFVQIGPFCNRRRFFSYLEAPGILLDFDRHGRLIFLEVDIPRRRWREMKDPRPPSVVEAADVRWLNFRNSLPQPALETNPDRTLLKLVFGSVDRPLNYYIAKSVISQTSPDHRLAALWITDIADDLAGRQISSFRKELLVKRSYFA